MRRTTISTFLVAAGLVVSGQAAWAQGPTVLQINCGVNSYTPAGWDEDDTYVDVGADFENWPTAVDATGVANAAPTEVYQTVRHAGDGSQAHTYTIPVASNGPYIVRMHFCDGYDEFSVRHTNYTIEGVVVESDFDYATAAGAFAKAVAKDYPVDVTDGDIVILCERADPASDVFEAGIEIILAEPPELDSIVVSPDIAYVRPGETVELTATPLDQYDDPFPATVNWVLSGGGTLSSATGTSTTFQSDGNEGTFTATASADGLDDTASVHVAEPELTTITITPETKVIPLDGGTVDLTAEALDQYGDPVSPAVTITWTVDPTGGPGVTPATGTTDAAGKHTTTFDSDGSTEGAFTVTATSAPVSGTATVTVTEQPIVTTLTLSATTYIVDNQGPPLTWTVLAEDQFGDKMSLVDVDFSIDPVGGTFDPTPTTTDGNGIASTVFTPDGTSTGDFTVTASSGDVVATKILKITGPPELTSIEVTPATEAIISGESVTLTARPLDQFGTPFATQVTWTVDSLDATLSPTTGGSTVFTSSAEGTYQVTATAGTDPDTVTDSATITVSPPVLTSVSITPASDTIPTNGTLVFTAEAQDQSGSPMTADITWSVDKGGTVDAGPSTTTTFYADTTEDTFTVTATATDDTDTVTHTVTVKVEAPVLTTVRVTPTGREIDVNASLDFTARTIDQFNAAFTATVDWTVDTRGGAVSPTTGTTDATGRHTTTFTSNGTVGDFTVTASATDGGVSVTDSTKITVLPELTGLGGGEGCVAGAPGLGLGVLLLLAAALAVARERRRAA